VSDRFTVLLVEDNPGDARLIEELLAEIRRERDGLRLAGSDGPAAFTLAHEETLAAGTERLDGADVVLLDLNLPDSRGIETVETTLAANDRVPVVVLTGVPEERLGGEAVSAGAQDYLVKEEITPDGLVRAIRYAVERKRSEEVLRQRTEQLALLNRLASHDIRNDMSLVVGRASELSDHVDPRGEELLDEVVSASNHVLQLTRTVGDSVATITGEEDVKLAPVELRPILEDEIETARQLHGAATITVDGELPDVRVRANRLLSSVFGNLLSNAMLYNDAEVPEVRVGVEPDDEAVSVRIADNGPGIPPHRQEAIFRKGTSEDDGGSGIGLYVVNRLVQRYDGEIRVENRDPGAAFFVTLQRA